MEPPQRHVKVKGRHFVISGLPYITILVWVSSPHPPSKHLLVLYVETHLFRLVLIGLVIGIVSSFLTLIGRYVLNFGMLVHKL